MKSVGTVNIQVNINTKRVEWKAYCNSVPMEELDTEANGNAIGPLRENNEIDHHLYETRTSCRRLKFLQLAPLYYASIL